MRLLSHAAATISVSSPSPRDRSCTTRRPAASIDARTSWSRRQPPAMLRPGRGEPRLRSRHDGMTRSAMLQHAQAAARPEHPSTLAQGRRDVAHGAQDEGAHDDIERVVGVRQCRGIPEPERHRASQPSGPPCGDGKGGPAGVDRVERRARWIRTQVQTRADADLQDVAHGPGRDADAGAPEAASIGGPHPQVIQARRQGAQARPSPALGQEAVAREVRELHQRSRPPRARADGACSIPAQGGATGPVRREGLTVPVRGSCLGREALRIAGRQSHDRPPALVDPLACDASVDRRDAEHRRFPQARIDPAWDQVRSREVWRAANEPRQPAS